MPPEARLAEQERRIAAGRERERQQRISALRSQLASQPDPPGPPIGGYILGVICIPVFFVIGAIVGWLILVLFHHGDAGAWIGGLIKAANAVVLIYNNYSGWRDQIRSREETRTSLENELRMLGV